MSSDVSLGSLSVAEKLALMERLWDDLSRRPEDVPAPQCHDDVLAKRIAAVRDGRTDFVEWDDAKRRLNWTAPLWCSVCAVSGFHRTTYIASFFRPDRGSNISAQGRAQWR